MARTKEDDLADLLRGQGEIMQETYSILEQEEKKDRLVRAAILASRQRQCNNLPGLDPARTYNLAAIRHTCIRFRLRFLPAGLYKGIVPTSAALAVRRLEQQAGKPVHGFMIMAPAKQFQLCDCDADPMLFIPLANGSYYLLHRWGRDVHPLRAVAAWPVRSWLHLVLTVMAVAAALAAMVPTAWLTTAPEASWWGIYRFGAFFCITMLAAAATSLSWFSFFGQFSANTWRSKHFN
ncbi:MAG: hypothetical protein IT230_04490 [Flavobacteriales bacterium]|nr:hypothetical protein [Flavobacteriales bacterium]